MSDTPETDVAEQPEPAAAAVAEQPESGQKAEADEVVYPIVNGHPDSPYHQLLASRHMSHS